MTPPGALLAESPQKSAPQNLAEIEKTLGAGLKELASELRLIDAADFAAFIRIGQMANLKSLVHSSTELHFKPGTLELAELGEIELGWFQPPLITLPMKFRAAGNPGVFPPAFGGAFGGRGSGVDHGGRRRGRRRSEPKAARGAARSFHYAAPSGRRLKRPEGC